MRTDKRETTGCKFHKQVKEEKTDDRDYFVLLYPDFDALVYILK